MSKNKVQFQKGMSLSDFLTRFGTQAQCEQALAAWRWPNGFVCPECGHTGHCVLGRGLFQCHRCRRQTSLTAGTLFAGTKLPLTKWLLAIYLLTQSKNGISALDLSRQLGVCYNSAWLMKHKLMQAMLEREQGRSLEGVIQLDDAYWGGRRRGYKRGRGTRGKTPFVAAVATDPQTEVGGVGVYGLWNNLLYAEFDVYRTANTGLFRPLAAGVTVDDVVNGTAPYWRLALQREAGPHSISVGAYGLVAKIYADRDQQVLGANRFKDFALDGQYEYIEGDHAFATSATWIREKQEWNASVAQGLASNSSSVLKTVRADVHYVYHRTYAGMLQYFATRGDQDALRYNTGEPVTGSASGSPNSRGWIAELNYLADVDWMPVVQHAKFALRYSAYTQFNGAGGNYDGFGRNAKDNNSLFLLVWFLI